MEIIDIESLKSENSFLVETTFNSDIGLDIRQEIDKKFKNSKPNQNYVFPRKENFDNLYSRRNLSVGKPAGNGYFNKSLLNRNTYKIYSREIVSLKRM